MLLTHFICKVLYRCVGQVLFGQFYLFIYHNGSCSYRALLVLGVTKSWCYRALIYLFICYLIWVLVTWPTPHPKNLAGGVCQYFYSRMGLWLWLALGSLMALAMLWSSLPTMLKLTRDTLWPVVLNGRVLVMEPSYALWTFLQMLCLIPFIFSLTVYPATLICVNHSTLL